MRRIMIAAALAALGAASTAVAQDTPPPGCRWQGDGVLACKDGKGHWRRSGDGEIVGTYPLAKPKPKPKPAAVAAAAPVPALPPPPPMTEPPAPVAAPEPAPPEALPPPVQAAAPAPAGLEAAVPAVAPAEVEAPRPWWRRWLDSIWRDIQALLRLFGIGR